ncbi:TauD/TfdA dioxygenase family protein [Rhodotorula paludigena]|uniref:TauD/TfdA dioxygenase family protein n=1 Tax=Rhodotorula paludigena TaxID=86838 RepID=UPI0031712A09
MATQTLTTTLAPAVTKLAARGSYSPLEPSGALDSYERLDLTPVIGTQYRNVQLPDLLKADKADELLRELAIVVSRRNVVFFKDQKRKLTNDELKTLARKLGSLSGGPSESGLHIHPTEHRPDEELSPITRSFTQPRRPGRSLLASVGVHSDVTFEPAPSSFAILNMHTLPSEGGGDTVWYSAYEAYDRLSPHYAKWLEGLTALHDGNGFHLRAKALGIQVHEGPRGHPKNVSANLQAVHPVIRTNPVTGWKGLFVNPAFTRKIVELNEDESQQTLKYLYSVIIENHDLQVRYRWDLNDVAIWSNTSSFHNVTVDYEGESVREGNRTVAVGEEPFFDPASKGRREALGLPSWL